MSDFHCGLREFHELVREFHEPVREFHNPHGTDPCGLFLVF